MDQDTNQPITGATARVGAANATTDPDGRYTLADLAPGQYVLSVTHPDYDPGLSSIFTLAAGEEYSLDLTLYAPDSSPYPKDPMLTNPLDPSGAPTSEDAERLARLQGLTGEVVNVQETKLSGEYLVNYKIGEEVRAAVAELNHEVWELTDDTGRPWWIIKVCGNLASPLPAEVTIATPRPQPVPLTVIVDTGELAVRICASEACQALVTLSRGVQVEVKGCLADRSWCQIGLPDGEVGWCQGEALRFVAAVAGVPAMEAVLPTPTPVAIAEDTEWIAYLGLDHNIWLTEPASGQQKQLTYAGEPAYSAGPAWSPDGTRLAVAVGGQSHPSGTSADLAIIDLAAGTLNRLGLYDQEGSPRVPTVGWPTWSADSSMIYYSISVDGMNRSWKLRRVRSDGSGGEEIPPVSRDWWWEGFPAFSPDGRWMTYGLVHQYGILPQPDDNWGIWLAEANGANTRQGIIGVTGKSAWSPDSTQVTFDAHFLANVQGDRGIFAVNIDGSNMRRLTDDGRYPTWSPDGRQIAFMRGEDNSSEIWVMNADGSNQRKIAAGSQPAWRPVIAQPVSVTSPISTSVPSSDEPRVITAVEGRIAFASDRDGNHEIYVMNADGSGLTRLTNHPEIDRYPAWSPTGQQIAFKSNRAGQGDIYVVNADGSGLTNLTNHQHIDTGPAWSPDGHQIAFSSGRDGNWEIYVMNADGSGLTRLTDHLASDGSPAWSPDGYQIAFTSGRDGNPEIYVMNAYGSGLTRLTNHPAGDWSPTWSPDGRQIAFMSDRDGNFEIYVMNADGSGLTRLTNHPANDLIPTWSPDGRRIAFGSERDENTDIYVMNADGSGLVRLTDHPAMDYDPAWLR